MKIEIAKYPLSITSRQLFQTENFIKVWATINNTVSMRDIAVTIQATERIARECVKILREKGKPIGSDGSGYWWANNSEQLDTAIRYAKAHRDSHAMTVDFLEQIQEKMEKTELIESF